MIQDNINNQLWTRTTRVKGKCMAIINTAISSKEPTTSVAAD